MNTLPPPAELAPRPAAELAVAAEGAKLLYAAGARKVWICGSLAHGQHWDAASDLDFVTTGLAMALRPQLTRLLTEHCGRNVDLIMLEDAPSFLRVQIVQAMIPVDRSGHTAAIVRGLRNPPAAPLSARPLPRGLHRQRHAAVVDVLLGAGSRRVLDLGCGRGALIEALVRAFEGADPTDRPGTPECLVTGIDPDPAALDEARAHLTDTLTPAQRRRVRLTRGGVADLDRHWPGHDALVAVEVIEHLDPPDLQRLGRVALGELRPRVAVFTTPNAEYNALFRGRSLRHPDHRFEWDREQLTTWASQHAEGYRFTINPIGEPHPEHGSPSQLLTFVRVGS
jgi:SAM-dependent methyltransferase/predicted nucleotidyltransferase